jgi:plasmid stabilization system protein ParE
VTVRKPLTFLAIAEADVERTVAWYEHHRPGLGSAFIDDLDELLSHIDAHPEIYQEVAGSVRRAVFKGFPYSVLYRILPDRIEVAGVLHAHLSPRRMMARSRPKPDTH